jgi:hypothetical protein
MKHDQLTPDILQTRSGGYPEFIGVVRQDGEIVWRSEQPRDMQARAWEDAERGLAMMTVMQARSK